MYLLNQNTRLNYHQKRQRKCYFEDEQAIQILQDIKIIKKGTKEQELANEFLDYFARINNIDISNIPEKNGALYRK